ncbi:hypothetical protein AX16_005903 [Volvariella volvacea WC 439]|nr:hypothetical protein AX16_005903 [Volvariella volvacea WC 439]
MKRGLLYLIRLIFTSPVNFLRFVLYVLQRMSSVRRLLWSWISGPAPRSKTDRIKRATPALVELPLEILTEIMQELSWRDILRVRQTCKCLFGASKTKFVWQAIAQKELSHNSNHPSELFLERPINTYTAQELERLILRWKSAEIGWTTDDGVPARERRLQLERSPSTRVECIHLVKGGRWLLVALSSGSVLFYDLDEKDPIQRILIPPSGSTIGLRKMDVDIDTSSPTLAFKLALLPVQKAQTISYVLEVWHVSLVRDTNCDTKCNTNYDTNSESSPLTLVAQRLVSFHPEPYGPVNDVSILGDRLAYSVTDEKACYAIVVRWTDLEETPSNFEKWVQPTNYGWVWSLLTFLMLYLSVYRYMSASFQEIASFSAKGRTLACTTFIRF